MTRVHKFSKNLEAISKFWALQEWLEQRSITDTPQILVDVAPGLCALPVLRFAKWKTIINSFRSSSCVGKDGPGIESRHPSKPSLGSTQPPAQGAPDLFHAVKRPGRGGDHPHLEPKLKKEYSYTFIAWSRVSFTFLPPSYVRHCHWPNISS